MIFMNKKIDKWGLYNQGQWDKKKVLITEHFSDFNIPEIIFSREDYWEDFLNNGGRHHSTMPRDFTAYEIPIEKCNNLLQVLDRYLPENYKQSCGLRIIIRERLGLPPRDPDP